MQSQRVGSWKIGMWSSSSMCARTSSLSKLVSQIKFVATAFQDALAKCESFESNNEDPLAHSFTHSGSSPRASSPKDFLFRAPSKCKQSPKYVNLYRAPVTEAHAIANIILRYIQLKLRILPVQKNYLWAPSMGPI